MLYLTDDKRLGKIKWVQMRASNRMAWRKRSVVQVLEDLEFDDSLIVSELAQLEPSNVGVHGDSIEP